jgi:hypothetical protein
MIKNKLKYIVISVIVILLVILVICYKGIKKTETFVNNDNSNKLDVLLGDNDDGNIRKILTDDKNDNNINIVYSTYKTTGMLSNEDLFFLRYKPNNDKYKIIGDLVDMYTVNENTLVTDIKNNIVTKDNIPQILNPIINETENAMVLSKTDLKDRIIINNSHNSPKTKELFSIMKYDNKKYNFKVIYDYYNGHTNDMVYNNLSTSQKFDSQYITFNKKESGNLIASVTNAKYNDIIKQYVSNKSNEIDIEKNILKTITQNIEIIITPTATETPTPSPKYYIPAGYKNNLHIFDFNTSDGDIIDEYNKSSLINNNNITDIIFLDIIFLENTQYETKIENYPIYILSSKPDPQPQPQPNYINLLITRYNNDIEKIKENFILYLEELKTLSNDNRSLDISLELIRFNNEDNDNEHIIFGDAINTDINKVSVDIFGDYLKIPKRCCRLYEDGLTYQDLQPIHTLTSLEDEIIEIYQHPIYKTFKAFKSTEDKNVPIYEIIPCAKKTNTYQDKIAKYQNLKQKCAKLQAVNQKVTIKDNTFNRLQMKTKLEDINENEKMINKLKKQATILERDINKKQVVNRAYNRNKLQNYNDKLYTTIYKGYKNLNRQSIGLNLNYTDRVIKHLIEKCKNNELLICGKKKEDIIESEDIFDDNAINNSNNNSSNNSINNSSNTEKKNNHLLDVLTNLLNSKVSPLEKDKRLKHIMHTCTDYKL